MKPLSIGMLAGVALASFAGGALIQTMLVRSGHSPFMVTPWLAVLFFALAVLLLVFGIGVRRLKRRAKTWMTPVVAGRTALLARSSAPICTAFSGALLGVSLASFMRFWAPAMAHAAWSAFGAGLMALLAAIAAVVVERWCIDNGSDQTDSHGSSSTKRRPGAASDAASARQSHNPRAGV